MRNPSAESAGHIVCHVIAGQQDDVRLERIDALDASLDIIAADGPAAMEIAGLHNPQLCKFARQIPQMEIFVDDFQPFGIFARGAYRPFCTESERPERCAFVVPPPFCLGYSNDSANSLFISSQFNLTSLYYHLSTKYSISC